MTNEEAIAIIRNEYKCVDRDCDIERSCGKCDLMMPSKEPILEAYKLAIKALEQQPCDDAISRILTRMWNCRGKHTTSIDKVKMEQIIRDELSVTQKSSEDMPCITPEEMQKCKDIVKKYTPKAIEQEHLRELTEEEVKAYSKALDKMYKPTGFNVFNDSCEDAVSRQAALNSLIDNTHLDGYDLAEALDAIENKEKLPTVTPQQKYGKWIKHPEIETSAPEYLMFYECSECGDKQCFCKSNIHKKRFCNNCGAKMVGPQESEDKTE